MNSTIYRAFACSAICFLSALSILGQRQFTGTVTKIIDGNTIAVDTGRAVFNVHLQFVVAPEEGQELHDTVKQHISKFVLNKPVGVTVQSVQGDLYYGRVIADGRDLSVQLLRDGAGWYSEPDTAAQDPKERNEYQTAEKAAKDEKRGVWGIANLTPAWQLRLDREKAANEKMAA